MDRMSKMWLIKCVASLHINVYIETRFILLNTPYWCSLCDDVANRVFVNQCSIQQSHGLYIYMSFNELPSRCICVYSVFLGGKTTHKDK